MFLGSPPPAGPTINQNEWIRHPAKSVAPGRRWWWCDNIHFCECTPVGKENILNQSDPGTGGRAVQLQCSACCVFPMTLQHGKFHARVSATEPGALWALCSHIPVWSLQAWVQFSQSGQIVLRQALALSGDAPNSVLKMAGWAASHCRTEQLCLFSFYYHLPLPHVLHIKGIPFSWPLPSSGHIQT